ncbi:MAG TPA: hypothetical protein VK899_05485, partial [Gemmatimonadales bacterium]|nr:hypothetical protein [Gemmatimonadales bacterium]
MSHLDLLDRARSAAEQAGQYLRNVERPDSPSGWTLKGRRDFVTEVDRTAEGIIRNVLQNGSRDTRIVGEELSPDIVTEGLVW